MIFVEKKVSGFKLNIRKDDIEKKDKERCVVNVIDFFFICMIVDLVGILCKFIL